ncbi:MAG: MBL fold metallo-hydrolase [Deltaproteobacteria bacterium]|nr:MBL fold metallo-hydrolase [Deltaproteobacteria bacterium]
MRTLLHLVMPLVCVLALPALAADQDDELAKTEIKTTPLGANLYLLQGEGGNVVALTGADGIALIDDEYAPLAPKIEAALGKVGKLPVKFLINTHWHGDHTGGNAIFGQHATIFAHENVRKRLLAGATRPDGRVIPPAQPAALPVVTFEEGLTLFFDDEEVKVIHLRPGHTDGDSAILFKKANVVHLGDDFVTYGFPFIDLNSGGSVRGMIAALDTLVPQLPKDAKIVPGHGPVSTIDDVKKFARTLEEIADTIDKAKKAGKTAEQMKKEKLLEPWTPAWGHGFFKADAFIDLVLKDSKS